jgi:hypothetical protein
MAASLLWKVKVVRSLLTGAACLVTVFSFAQSVLQQRVSFAFENVRVENVLRHLERTTEIRFVYSSSKITLDDHISLVVFQRPVQEVLQAIGKQVHLEFKGKDNYVIIRHLPPPSPLQENPVTRQASLKRTPAPIAEEQPAANQEFSRMVALNDESISRTVFHDLLETTVSPDTALFTHLSLTTPTNTLRKQRTTWLVSAGLFANDYSGGTEIRAGVRPLYAVLNAGLIQGGYLRKGYGVGTTLQLSRKFSVNPIYTFSDLKVRKEIGMNLYAISTRHHQFKMMMQFAVTRNITVMAGPSFNTMMSEYTYQSTRWQAHAGSPGAIKTSPRVHVQNISYTVTFPDDPSERPFTAPAYQILKNWVGFECGVTYSLNFSRR